MCGTLLVVNNTAYCELSASQTCVSTQALEFCVNGWLKELSGLVSVLHSVASSEQALAKCTDDNSGFIDAIEYL